MSDLDGPAVKDHWERDGLGDAILDALTASGRDLATLTVDDLAPLDQFHGGGLGFTRRLATLAGLAPEMRVLDVGGGLGGPARTLAVEFGCQVTVIDVAESYVEAGRMLTSLLALDDRVAFHVGDALELPFEDDAFDAVWTQNSGMNIADKGRLYAEFHRVIRPGGRLVTQEPMSGPVQPPIYPLMWADDPATDHVRAPDEMRAVIEAAGFSGLEWSEVRIGPPPPAVSRPTVTIQSLVMGDVRVAEIQRASRRNEDEDRIVMVHAVFAAGSTS
jgi:SAM-dependent methyltransferase